MWEHWRNSFTAKHFLQQEPVIEPGLQQCMELQQFWGDRLPHLRSRAVDEVLQLVHDQAEETQEWWAKLPSHIQPVYFDPETGHLTQVPIFGDLLKMFGYPAAETMLHELNNGFAITGVLNKGFGWMPRTDQRYDFPLSAEAFRKHNQHYVAEKVRSNRVDPHWREMLTELEKELQRGRMSGPFRAPSWWPGETIGLPEFPLMDLPEDDIRVAFCFSVVQQDKIRRCEDLRRSGHNSTIVAHDVPYHHTIGTFAALARGYAIGGQTSSIWTQDLQGAYRQFPVELPNQCFCAIVVPDGVVLVRHHAIMFGATAAVWNFNRAADALL